MEGGRTVIIGRQGIDHYALPPLVSRIWRQLPCMFRWLTVHWNPFAPPASKRIGPVCLLRRGSRPNGGGLNAKHVDWNSNLVTNRGKLRCDYAKEHRESFTLLSETVNRNKRSAYTDILIITRTKPVLCDPHVSCFHKSCSIALYCGHRVLFHTHNWYNGTSFFICSTLLRHIIYGRFWGLVSQCQCLRLVIIGFSFPVRHKIMVQTNWNVLKVIHSMGVKDGRKMCHV
jgi:hypothetical protein